MKHIQQYELVFMQNIPNYLVLMFNKKFNKDNYYKNIHKVSNTRNRNTVIV